MKKILSASMALVAVLSLAACSGNKSDSKASSASSSSKTVESSSTKASSTATSTSSTDASSKVSTVSLEDLKKKLLSDEEISAIKTIGDYKKAFSQLADNYAVMTEELGNKLPESQRKTFTSQIDTMKKQFETAKAQIETSLSQVGDDNTEIPSNVKDMFVKQLSSGRDTMAQAMASAQEMLSSLN